MTGDQCRWWVSIVYGARSFVTRVGHQMKVCDTLVVELDDIGATKQNTHEALDFIVRISQCHQYKMSFDTKINFDALTCALQQIMGKVLQ